MPEAKREAALSFKLEDIDSFIAGLDAIRARLEALQAAADTVSRGGVYTATPAAPLGSRVLPGGYPPAAPQAATFSAGTDPNIPLTPSPAGTPQQQRVAPTAATGNYSTPPPPVVPDGTQGDATTLLPPQTLRQWISRGVQSAGMQAEQIIGMIPGAAALLRFAANPVVAFGGAAIAGLSAYAYNYLNTWITEQEWAQGGVGVTPGMRGELEAQRQVGWIPFLGPLLMRPIRARMSLENMIYGTALRISAIGGRTDVLKDALNWALYDAQTREQSEQIGILGRLKRWVGITDAPRGATFVPWAKEILQTLNMTVSAAPWLSLMGMTGNLFAGLDQIIQAFQKFNMLGSDLTRGALTTWGRPEWALARTGILESPRWGFAYLPFMQGAANTMAALYASLGDVENLINVLPFAGSTDARVLLHRVAVQQRRAALADLYTAQAGELEARTSAMEAFGESGVELFRTRRAAQNRYGLAEQQAAERLRVLYRERDDTGDPNMRYAYDLAIAWETTRYRQIQSAYAGAGRAAGLSLIGYETGMLQTLAELALLEGGSPAPYMLGEAAWYGDLLAHPEAYLGRGVRLSPMEQIQYRLRGRAAALGAIEAEMRYTGGIALARQRAAQAGIAGRMAAGELWSAELEQAFAHVGEHTRSRIEAIDRAIQQYAAQGITEGAKVESLQAERAELQAAYRQVQAEAFRMKYQALGVPVQAAQIGAEAGIGAAIGLGGSAERLRRPFALERTAANVRVHLARSRYFEAVGRYGSDSIYAMEALSELDQAMAARELLPVRQIETEYGLRARPWAAYAAGYAEAAGIEEAAFGSRRALGSRLQGISMADMLAGVAADKYSAIRSVPGVGPALIAEAWQELTARESAVRRSYLALGEYNLPPEIAELLERAQYTEHMLRSTMTARGSVRGAVRERMYAAEQGIADLTAYREQVLRYVPAELRPAVEHALNRRLRGLEMERISAIQELEQGWLERLISGVWNAPANFSLVAGGFNYANAVMRHGVRARHLGATSADLNYYREQAMNFMSYAGAGRFGTPRTFLESALAGVTGGATTNLRIEVVVRDPNGTVLGAAHRNVTQDEFGNSISVNLGLQGTMSPL